MDNQAKVVSILHLCIYSFSSSFGPPSSTKLGCLWIYGFKAAECAVDFCSTLITRSWSLDSQTHYHLKCFYIRQISCLVHIWKRRTLLFLSISTMSKRSLFLITTFPLGLFFFFFLQCWQLDGCDCYIPFYHHPHTIVYIIVMTDRNKFTDLHPINHAGTCEVKITYLYQLDSYKILLIDSLLTAKISKYIIHRHGQPCAILM